IEIAQGLEVQHHFDIVAEQQSNGDAVIVLGDGPVAVANDAMQALQAGALVGVRDLPAVDGDDSPGAEGAVAEHLVALRLVEDGSDAGALLLEAERVENTGGGVRTEGLRADLGAVTQQPLKRRSLEVAFEGVEAWQSKCGGEEQAAKDIDCGDL